MRHGRKKMQTFQPVLLVASCVPGVCLNLENVALRCHNTKYDSRQTAKVFVTRRSDRNDLYTIEVTKEKLMFKGKFSEWEAKMYLRRCLCDIKQHGQHVRFLDFRVCLQTWKAKLDIPVDLVKLSTVLPATWTFRYEAEVFSAATININEQTNVSLFSSGSVLLRSSSASRIQLLEHFYLLFELLYTHFSARPVDCKALYAPFYTAMEQYETREQQLVLQELQAHCEKVQQFYSAPHVEEEKTEVEEEEEVVVVSDEMAQSFFHSMFGEEEAVVDDFAQSSGSLENP